MAYDDEGCCGHVHGWLTCRPQGNRCLAAGVAEPHVLMTVAITGAFLINHWPDAARVMALNSNADVQQARAADCAQAAIRRMMELAPEWVPLQIALASSVQVPAAAVAVGQMVRVEPGEFIPLDGGVKQGRSALTDNGHR